MVTPCACGLRCTGSPPARCFSSAQGRPSPTGDIVQDHQSLAHHLSSFLHGGVGFCHEDEDCVHHFPPLFHDDELEVVQVGSGAAALAASVLW